MSNKKYEIKLLKHQRAFLESNASQLLLLGGYGAGKTDAGIIKTLVNYLKYGNLGDVGYWLPTNGLIKSVAVPKLFSRLDDMGLTYSFIEKPVTKIKVDDLDFSIFLASMDRPDTLVGYELISLVIDELDTLRPDKASYIYRMGVARTRKNVMLDGVQVKNQVAVVTTPDQGKNGFCCKHFENSKDPEVQLIRARTEDNTFAKAEYKETLSKLMTPEQIEAFLNGECVSFNTRKVYKYFDKHNIVRPIKNSPTGLDKKTIPSTIYVGLDFNIGGTCAVIGDLQSDKLVIFDEIVTHDTHEFARVIRAKYQKQNIVVVPDTSGYQRSTNSSVTDIQMLIAAGFLIHTDTRNPLVRDRVNNLNVLFIQKKVEILDTCKNLIFALQNQGYSSNGEPEKFNNHPAIDDWNDALGYLTYQKMNTTNAVNKIRTSIV